MHYAERARRRESVRGCFIRALGCAEDAEYALATVWCAMALMHLTYLTAEEDVQRIFKHIARGA